MKQSTTTTIIVNMIGRTQDSKSPEPQNCINRAYDSPCPPDAVGSCGGDLGAKFEITACRDLPTSAKHPSGVSIAPPHFDSAHLWRGRRQSHELKKAMSENGKRYLHKTKGRLKEENLTASLPLKHVRKESIERGIQAYSTVSPLSHPDHRSWPILQVFSLSIQNARGALLMVALHSTRRRTLLINIASTSALCTGQGEGLSSFSLVSLRTYGGLFLFLTTNIRP